MKRNRIVWNEGLLLTPQHFQQQDRYHEARSTEILRAARPFLYGFTDLALDEEAISNGRVVIQRAAGILPGGTPFAIPDCDPSPAAISVAEDFAAGEQQLPVFLGLRVHRPGEAEIDPGGDPATPTRYRSTTEKLTDEAGGTTERELHLAQLNIRLLREEDSLGDYEILPLAQVVRLPEGSFAYRPDFIPTALTVGASTYITRILKKVLEMLMASSTLLAGRRRRSGKGLVEFGRDDTAGFWLLGVVNGYIPLVAHQLRSGATHPEQTYQLLAQMVGELSTMSELDVRDIQPYDHDHQEICFADLEERAERLLQTVVPQHYTAITLERRDEAMFAGKIVGDRLLDPSVSFFLGVFANMPLPELQARFADEAKIASEDRIETILALALKGVDLHLAQVLPASLPVKAGWVYFQIEKRGEVWDGIAAARTIAVYAPTEFPGVTLELIAVHE